MSEMVKVCVLRDCEHGEAGKVLEVDADRLPAFLAEGKVERYVEEPEPEYVANVPLPRPGRGYWTVDDVVKARDEPAASAPARKPATAPKAAPKPAPKKPAAKAPAKKKGKR